tara:strand:- start:15276 stop:15506 length:231 start_codon:yes stop_codon:yes gene_type:complete
MPSDPFPAAPQAAPTPPPQSIPPQAPRPRPSRPATLVPVSNGFVLVIDGGPVAVAGLEDEQVAGLARDWARGVYGG